MSTNVVCTFIVYQFDLMFKYYFILGVSKAISHSIKGKLWLIIPKILIYLKLNKTLRIYTKLSIIYKKKLCKQKQIKNKTVFSRDRGKTAIGRPPLGDGETGRGSPQRINLGGDAPAAGGAEPNPHPPVKRNT